MTPKEKAIQLYEKFDNPIYHDAFGVAQRNDIIKQCALIAVKELITLDNEWLEDRGASNESIYWNEVKQEIEKLCPRPNFSKE